MKIRDLMCIIEQSAINQVFRPLYGMPIEYLNDIIYVPWKETFAIPTSRVVHRQTHMNKWKIFLYASFIINAEIQKNHSGHAPE